MKRAFIAAFAAAMLLTMTGCGNNKMIDTVYTFNYAYIKVGDKTVEGTVENRMDYSDSEQLQITIDGVTYLTSAENVLLVYDPKA